MDIAGNNNSSVSNNILGNGFLNNFSLNKLLNRNPIELNLNRIKNSIENKNILISGAAGSIGREITHQILEFQPKKIILIDQAESPLYSLIMELQSYNKSVEIIPILCDIRNKSYLEYYFEKYNPEIVYHAAAYKHVPLMEENPSEAFLTNVIGTKNLADLSIKYSIDNFVMVSTDKAVNPSNVMGATKRLAELYIKSLGQKLENDLENNSTKFISTRFGNVLGSNGSVVPLFNEQIMRGGPLTITHPEITRYFMTVSEACQLVIEAGSMGNGGEIFIFDMGSPIKIIDLATQMIQFSGKKTPEDIQIKFVGLRPGEKLHEELITHNAVTLPTHHPQIMIMKEEKIDYNLVNHTITETQNQLEKIDHDLVVKMLKKIIPEYKSINSVYESIDK